MPMEGCWPMGLSAAANLIAAATVISNTFNGRRLIGGLGGYLQLPITLASMHNIPQAAGRGLTCHGQEKEIPEAFQSGIDSQARGDGGDFEGRSRASGGATRSSRAPGG